MDLNLDGPSNASVSPQPARIKVNLIENLHPFPHILEKIFSYLRPKDLRVVPCVCYSWLQSLYHLSPNANRRRQKSLGHLKKVKRQVGSENWPIDLKCASLKRKLRREEAREQVAGVPDLPDYRRKTLSSIQNTVTTNFRPKRNVYPYEDAPPEEVRKAKKARWVLAQEPFKKW